MSGGAVSGECSSVAREIFNETEEFLRRGIQGYKDKNLQEAIEALAHVLEARSQHFGEFSLECAEAHYYYGVSLFELSKLNSGVFGVGPIAQQIVSKDEGPSDASAAPAETTANDENADNATISSSEDDQVLAWDALEVAKRSYEKDGVEKHRGELADVHCALADMNVEQGNADAAFDEYKMALDLLKESENANEQRLSEVHFRFSIGLELEERYNEAKEHTLHSISYLEQKIASINTGPKADAGCTTSDLEGVITSLQERITDLTASIESQEQVREMVKSMFAQGLKPGGGLSKPTSLEPSTDIGVVGRGKERITLKPVGDSAVKDKDDGNQSRKNEHEKRSADGANNSSSKPNPKKARIVLTKTVE